MDDLKQQVAQTGWMLVGAVIAGLAGLVALTMGYQHASRLEATAQYRQTFSPSFDGTFQAVDVATPGTVIFGWVLVALAAILLTAYLIGLAARR